MRGFNIRVSSAARLIVSAVRKPGEMRYRSKRLDRGGAVGFRLLNSSSNSSLQGFAVSGEKIAPTSIPHLRIFRIFRRPIDLATYLDITRVDLDCQNDDRSSIWQAGREDDSGSGLNRKRTNPRTGRSSHLAKGEGLAMLRKPSCGTDFALEIAITSTHISRRAPLIDNS